MTARQQNRIEGVNEIARVLRLLPQKLGDKALASSVRAGANVIRKEIKARAPAGGDEPHPKFGRLRDNIRVSRIRSKPGTVRLVIHTGRAFWGMFFEFGTRFLPARPFMRPAFDTKRQEAFDKIGKQLGRNIEKAAEKLAGSFAKSGLKAGRRGRRR